MTIRSKLESLLLRAGLSEAETMVYAELLKNPAQQKWELVERTGLSKSNVYRAINRLEELKMIAINNEGLRALSPKGLVAELNRNQRKLGKLADQIRTLAPYLKAPGIPVEEFETFYTQDQISEAYIFMSRLDYDINLDLGDFENFVNRSLGTVSTAFKFRENRMKHASHRAICTSYGPNSYHFCTREAEKRFKNSVELLDLDFDGQFTIFSEGSDYVLFNNFSDPYNTHSVLVKSRVVADAQRANFYNLSKKYKPF